MQPVIDGADTLANVLVEMQKDTRHFARRQRTWLRAERDAVWMHPDDASKRDLVAGESVHIESRVGSVEALLEVREEMMRGVVSLPHGWGHDRAGARQSLARDKPGVSCNDLPDDG